MKDWIVKGIDYLGYPLYANLLLLEGEKIMAKGRESFSKKVHLNFLNLEKFWPLFY
jgi:hypothetical protein